MKHRDLFLACILAIVMFFACCEEEPPTEIEETTEETIKWSQEEEQEEEVTVDEIENETVTESEVELYDVPLSKELQLHIFSECEKYNIAPSIIIAMIEVESNYDASIIGDNGDSFGLMQVQPKWHKERMQKLGVTNLLNPFQNVTVAIDLVNELKEKNEDIGWVLMSYNAGEKYANAMLQKGKISDYAAKVVEIASRLEKEMEDVR